MDLNPFRAFGTIRALRLIAEELRRSNTLKEAELDALTISYPPRKLVRGKDAEIEISYSLEEEVPAKGEEEEE